MSESGLRYPGGKSRSIKHIIKYIPERKIYVSPFLGGGSIELELTKRKDSIIYGYDIFNPLITYWKCLIEDSNKLSQEIEKLHSITKEQFMIYRKELLLSLETDKESKLKSNFELAAKYFALNRSSFSGTTLSGGYSKESAEKRFTKTSIERVKSFNHKNIIVNHSDFIDTINKHSQDFLYLDPPYYTAKKLYGKNGEQQNINHDLLFKLLNQRDNWILSYDNCEYINNLYKDYCKLYPKWNYGMSKDKKSKEILIFSHDIKKELDLDTELLTQSFVISLEVN